jgi:hypothetical protein
VLITMGLTPFVALLLPESLPPQRGAPGTLEPVRGDLRGALAHRRRLGPILDTFFVRSKMSRHAVVATKASTQSLSHTLKIGYFGSVLALGSGGPPWVGIMMVAFSVRRDHPLLPACSSG